jgi:flagellar hook-basal body complex protein FliE
MEPVSVNLGGVQPVGSGPAAEPGGPAQGSNFREMLDGYLREVNSLQTTADVAVRDLAVGKSDSVHDVIVAVSEADLSFRLMMEVRNRLLEAYKEIMRMQV